jgi:hypothetical protein
MMTTKIMRNLENLIGVGIVYQEGTPVAKARYALTVRQEVHIVQSWGGTSQVDGLTSAEGSLTVIEGQEWLMETANPLVLELEDKRRMHFLAVNYTMSNKYRIVRTGGWLNPE